MYSHFQKWINVSLKSITIHSTHVPYCIFCFIIFRILFCLLSFQSDSSMGFSLAFSFFFKHFFVSLFAYYFPRFVRSVHPLLCLLCFYFLAFFLFLPPGFEILHSQSPFWVSQKTLSHDPTNLSFCKWSWQLKGCWLCFFAGNMTEILTKFGTSGKKNPFWKGKYFHLTNKWAGNLTFGKKHWMPHSAMAKGRTLCSFQPSTKK